MSPEMKKKLRQEYLGLGGSTNTVSRARVPVGAETPVAGISRNWNWRAGWGRTYIGQSLVSHPRALAPAPAHCRRGRSPRPRCPPARCRRAGHGRQLFPVRDFVCGLSGRRKLADGSALGLHFHARLSCNKLCRC
eukprot:364218-Chlamydomonas_euryale.AAC.15